MDKRITQAQNIINLMMYTYVGINAVLVLTYFIFNGFGAGLYRLITLGIGTAITVALFKAIRDGSSKAKAVLCTLLLIGVTYGINLIINQYILLNKIILIIMVQFDTACLLYLLFSKNLRLIKKHRDTLENLRWLWSWGGKSLGYMDKGYLWSAEGDVIGKFVENEIFSPEGKYLGEIYTNNNRLYTDKDKAGKTIDAFEASDKNIKVDKRKNTSPLNFYGCYEEFSLAAKD